MRECERKSEDLDCWRRTCEKDGEHLDRRIDWVFILERRELPGLSSVSFRSKKPTWSLLPSTSVEFHHHVCMSEGSKTATRGVDEC